MQRFSFNLNRVAAKEFQFALQTLQGLRAGGWTLTRISEGFSGGLPAGQFVLVNGDARETITFRLDGKSLDEFRATVRKLDDLPAGQWTFADVELDLRDELQRAVILLEPSGLAGRAVVAPTRALRKQADSARTKYHQSLRRRPSAYALTEVAALEVLRRGVGPEADQLRALVGDDYFDLLRDLARKAEAKRRGTRPKAFVLPGIMGSKLGTKESVLGLKYDDVIWLNPLAIRLGRLADLTLTHSSKPRNKTLCVGVLYIFYLRLKLSLHLAGFDADFYDFDWRRPLRDLGQEFARFLKRHKQPVCVVAHSMGGLVTRAALKAGADNIKRFVMIGTPNHGSFVPAQALRAAYPFLKNLAILFDRDLVTITHEVFASFAGLYDLLAVPEKFPAFPLFDPARWPKSPPRFRPDLLKTAARVQDLLAPADDRFHLICGVNQETVVDLRVQDGEFVYLQTKDGDGTVPRISAELPNCPPLYVEGSHGMLPNSGLVCDLAVDLACDGRTARSTFAWTPPTEAPREVRESVLRSAPVEIRGLQRGEEPSPALVREMLKPLLALPPLEPTAGVATGPAKPESVAASTPSTVEASFAHELKGVVVGRRRQRQLEVALFSGSLTRVSSRAYVMGLFKGVAPAGAALAVDELMGGVIKDFVERRMLSGNLGEVFIVPKGRSFVPADHVIFAGLGTFDEFKHSQRSDAGDPDAMRLVCESVVRTCLHANIEEFATVLLGGSAADDIGDAVELFGRSFLGALQAVDLEHRLRKITLCETDPHRMAEIRTELLQLATTDLFDKVELELRDLLHPAPLPSAVSVVRGGAVGRRSTPLYLLARMFEPALPLESKNARRKRPTASPPSAVTPAIVIETSLLMPHSKAAVLTGRHEVPPKAKLELLAPIGNENFSLADLNRLGRNLVEFVFDGALRQALRQLADTIRDVPLVVVHDSVASQLPWEAFRFGEWIPALAGGVTRQHLDANLSVAKWLEHRLEGPFLDVLLVTNPTGDLDAAEAEGDAVRTILNRIANVRVTERRQSQATRPQLLADFRSGQFDVIHYAGHAFFDPAHPGRAGVVCAGQEVVSGADLAGLSGLPTLVFFNACESARIRGRKPGDVSKTKSGARARTESNLSLASAFIRGGVTNFLGTYWPVGDFAAKKFSETFYPSLIEGRTIGDSVLAGRRVIEQAKSVDWADYVLFGSPDFVLKRQAPQ